MAGFDEDMSSLLPSWRPGAATRYALLDFLVDDEALPPEARLACFDNDVALWCERPNDLQWDFLVDALDGTAAEHPHSRHRPEFHAILEDHRALLVDHDDAEREYAYSATVGAVGRTLAEVGAESGRLTVSVEQDWAEVFPPVDDSRTGATS